MELRPTTPEEIAEAVLTHLKSVPGPQVAAILLKELQEDYFGSKTGTKAAIAQRPELFERGRLQECSTWRGGQSSSSYAKRSTPSSTLAPT